MTANSKIDRICTEYFEEFFYRFPVKATKLGIHRYDYRLGSFSKKDFEEWADFLKNTKNKVSSLKVKKKRELDYSLLARRIDNELNWVINEREYETNPLMYTSAIKDGLFYSAFGAYAPLSVRGRNFLDRLNEIESIRKAAEENLQFADYLEKEIALQELRFLYEFVDEFSSYLIGKSDIEKKDDFRAARVKALKEINEMLNFIEKLPGAQDKRRLSFVKKIKREYLEDYPLNGIRLDLQNRLTNLSRLIENKAREIKISQSSKETLEEIMNDKKMPTLEEISVAFDNIKRAGESKFGKTNSSIEFKLMMQIKNGKFDSGIVIPLGPFDAHTTIPLMLASPISPYLLLLKIVSLGYPGKSYESEIKKRKSPIFRKFFENSVFDEGWKLYVKRTMKDSLKQIYGNKFELVFLYDQYETLFKALIENELLNKRISVEEFKEIVEKDRIILDKMALLRDVITENGKSLKSVIGLDSIINIKRMFTNRKMREKEFHIKLLSHSSLPFKFIRQVLRR